MTLISPTLIYCHIMRYYGLKRIVIPTQELSAVNMILDFYDLPYHYAQQVDNFVIIQRSPAYNKLHANMQNVPLSCERAIDRYDRTMS